MQGLHERSVLAGRHKTQLKGWLVERTFIEAGNGGTFSGACTFSARTDPTASTRSIETLGRA